MSGETDVTGGSVPPSEHDVALAVRELDALVAELRALGEVGAALLVERAIAQVGASARPARR